MLEEKKIVIHIGPPKTGSTSIQDMLSNNQRQLLQQGFLYSLSGRLSKAEYYVVNRPDGCVKYYSPLNSHGVLAWSLNNNVEGVDADSVWQSLMNEIRESTAHTIILSAETFSRLSKENICRIADYVKPYRVKIVAYQRDYLSHILSIYTQNVKQGRVSNSFGEFVREREEKLFYLPQAVFNWSEFFDMQCIHIKHFDAAKEQGLTLDSLMFIGLSSEESEKIYSITKRKNSSPSPSKVRLVCLVNRIEKLPMVSLIPKEWFKKLRKLIMRSSVSEQMSLIIGHPLYNKDDENFLQMLDEKVHSKLSAEKNISQLMQSAKPL